MKDKKPRKYPEKVAPAPRTPGDWYVANTRPPEICADGPKGRLELATVHEAAEYAASLPARANAELMAAAPAMLKALSAFVASQDGILTPEESQKATRAAFQAARAVVELLPRPL